MPWTQGASNATGGYTVGGTQTYQQANNDEYQYIEAILSLEQHLFTPFVLTGGVSTIHGGLPKQLDFTAIDAFLTQPVDASGQNTVRWRHVAAGNFTSSVASTTYFLDLNPDGTMSWGTAHSGQANYLPICSVTTDGSQNLVTITDARTLNTSLLSTALGRITLPNAQYVSKTGDTMSGGLTVSAGGVTVTGGATSVDNGLISTNGAGQLTAQNANANGSPIIAKLTGSSAGDLIGLTATSAGAHTFHLGIDNGGNVYLYDATGSDDVFVGTAGKLASNVFASRSNSYIGFKNNSGVKIAEFGKTGGTGADMIIGGTTYWTTQTSSGFNNSASFDAFDVSEVYETDQAYAHGVVVCPQGAVMRRCTHDGCHAAMVVSKTPGFAMGGGHFSDEEEPVTTPHELCAIAGRIRVTASGPIAERALVIADGIGGVRAMRTGETGFTLGVALDAASDGRVGIVFRPMYCVAP